MRESTILETRHVCYRYADGTEALNDLNISIKKGSATAILGGNGAGKSTLLLTLNGILKPVSGQILRNGKPLDYSAKGLLELRKNVGMVFQSPDHQLFSASVYEDISFGPMNLGLPEKEVHERVRRIMEKTGVAPLKDKPTHWLSFGQKKRVAIAGVLVMQPEVLVLDEPTAGLDPVGTSEMMKLVKSLAEELGLTLVIATHDLDTVALYCDAGIVMSEGKAIFQGGIREMFADKEMLRGAQLRLTRIGHLMEILETKDGFEFTAPALTISQARKELNRAMRNNGKD
ncbi:cobalt ABC transporter, ATPase subunit [Chloroherpeton thalassium ATCC 35110]|uniref:ABC transporter ATP-binding protein n=1 Tax=Chloroherpeton thalassium (strain ATCC 35110 / GB-78) TaxID=517418 RepID=B3QW24_CHLT3|nr:ATP-binding cassette domain-containing protein [Chloroherpeton thalassium]ACF14678.1 cobalt ABC transporter, ATPase subunit [Chloroherpeton thalassium ATCC 35110]